jgi:hypothetical protein
LMARPCAMGSRPIPSGPEGSSGKRPAHETQCAWPELKVFFRALRGAEASPGCHLK